MPLADLTAPVEKPDDIICKSWHPTRPGERQCKHFLADGACALPTEFMCVEWMRAQGMLHQFELSSEYTEADIQLGELHASARRLRLARGEPDRVAVTAPTQPPDPAPVSPTPTVPEPQPSKLQAALAMLKQVGDAPQPAPAKPAPSSGLQDALAKLNALK